GDGSLSLRAPDGGINFILDLGFLRRGPHANLDVELPRLATIQLETASADVRCDGLHGTSHFRTASGELMLTAAGGSIDIEAVSGDVHVTADAEVSVGCRTVSGEVSVESPTLRRLQVTTTSGDIRATGDMAGEGPFSIDTVSGDADLVTSSGLSVEAKTVAGDIRSPEGWKADRGPGRRTLVVGSGQTRLAFHSISGSLRISDPNGRPGLRGETAAPQPPRPPAAPPSPDAPGAPVDGPNTTTDDAATDDTSADRRLDILRALERGELTVEDATAQLAELDAEGER
ncbi:MAG: DUF4097 domain-containing protein, partial [Chloroflexi bacterium]|nr:DUF4097 domain-containing protein [Chloroflexota bacterium]